VQQMKPVIASTGPTQTVEAGAAVMSAGGNALDATVAAILAWPPALCAAGVLVAVGSGLGRGVALFPARVPGFGLSRPRRFRLLGAHAAAAKVATPCAAQTLAAVLGRWGTVSIVQAAKAAWTACADAPHRDALELLAEEGVNAIVRGLFATEAAKSLGPLAGGLVTRRDLIEARPELGEARGPVADLWMPWSLTEARQILTAARGYKGESEMRTLALVVVGRRGVVVSASLEAGAVAEPMPEPVFGVPPNTLLALQTAARAKKVGQALAVLCGAAAGCDTSLVGLAGPLSGVLEQLEKARQDEALEPVVAEDVLWVRRSPRGRLEVNGAASIERS